MTVTAFLRLFPPFPQVVTCRYTLKTKESQGVPVTISVTKCRFRVLYGQFSATKRKRDTDSGLYICGKYNATPIPANEIKGIKGVV